MRTNSCARRARTVVLASSALALCLGCANATEPAAEVPTVPAPPAQMSATAKSVLDQFYGALQNRSVRRREVDWASLRTEVHALAGTAQDPEELNPAILRALTVMDDRHSRYVSRRGTLLRYRPVTCTAPNRTVPALPADVGYVHVNYFGGTAVQSAAFATQLQDSIRAQDRDGLAGWIIDLRGNTGGSMWPMVAGIGPLLADSLFGYFIDPDNSREPLVYRNGSSLLNGSVLATAQRPYVVRNRAARVAVLTDQLTASSGEAVAIAFQARPNTRTLGSASCGQSTVIIDYELFDHSTLLLAVSTMADRTGRKFGGAILPDETIVPTDTLFGRAISWLRSGR